MKWILVLFYLLLLSNDVLGAPDEAIGRVVSVISGDSFGIEVQLSDPRTHQVDSVKLADVISPSTVFPAGKVAREYANSMLKNKTVFLDIDDNLHNGRNEWGQLVCTVYLMDSNYKPIWPCFNRMLVDSLNAELQADETSEFNASSWWENKPSLPKETRARLLKMDEEKAYIHSDQPANSIIASSKSSRNLGIQHYQYPKAKTNQAFAVVSNNPNSTSILKKDPNSGMVSIGYR